MQFSTRYGGPINVLERGLHAVATLKMCAFHWQLVDHQGMRVKSKRSAKREGWAPAVDKVTRETPVKSTRLEAHGFIFVIPEGNLLFVHG